VKCFGGRIGSISDKEKLMKRISSARLKELEKDGAKISHIPMKGEKSAPGISELLQSQQETKEGMESFVKVLGEGLSGLAVALKPETIIKEVPVEVEVPVSIDYNFVVNRDKDGLIKTVDMKDPEGNISGRAVFKRNENYQVVGISTKPL